VGQFYFGDNVDKWVKFKLALTFVKIKRLKDQYKHPVYQQEEEKAAE